MRRTWSRTRSIFAGTVLLALVASLAIGCSTAPAASVAVSSPGAGSASAAASLGPSSSPGAIIREDLGSTLPAVAAGERLGLWHYEIPAGAALPPHHHPGWQVARITAGTLTYQIIAGQATVIRGSGATEVHSAGETVTVATGDTVVENPDLEHFGANNGTVTVEIYTATLFTDGSPPAILLPSASASASPHTH